MAKVLICGFGLFGKALLARLEYSGYQPKVLTKKVQNIEELGPKASIKEGSSFDFVFGCRRTSHDIIDLLEEAKVNLTTFIDLATNPPDLVSDLYQKFSDKKIRYIELPQLGSSVSLRDGNSCSLILEKYVDDGPLMHVVDLLGSKIACKSPLDPCKLKLVHNYLAAAHLSIYGESMFFAKELGICREDIFVMLRRSPMWSPLLEAKSQKILSSSYHKTQFSVRNMLKDLRIIKDIFEFSGSTRLFSLFKNTVDSGHGDKDTSAVVES